MSDRITKFTLTIAMHEPIDRERLMDDLADHIVPTLRQEYQSGEMLVPVGKDREVRGWWEVSWEGRAPRKARRPR